MSMRVYRWVRRECRVFTLRLASIITYRSAKLLLSMNAKFLTKKFPLFSSLPVRLMLHHLPSWICGLQGRAGGTSQSIMDWVRRFFMFQWKWILAHRMVEHTDITNITHGSNGDRLFSPTLRLLISSIFGLRLTDRKSVV